MYQYFHRQRVLSSTKGVTLTDYGIIIAFVVVLSIGALVALGASVRDTFNTADQTLSTAIASGPVVSAQADGAGEEPAPVEPVALRDFGAVAKEASATSVTVQPPAESEVGDLMLSFILHRSPVAPPSGWSLVINKTPALEPGGSFGTYLSVFERVQNGSVGAATFTQDSANRFKGQMYSISGTDPTIIATDGFADFAENHGQTFSAAADTLAISARTTAFALGASSVSASVTAPWTLTSESFAENIRLFVAHRTLSGEAGNEVAYPVFETNVTDFDDAQIILQIAPAGTSDASVPAAAPTLRSTGSQAQGGQPLVTEIPDVAQAGDLLVASVRHRGTLTVPAGWDLERTQEVPNPGGPSTVVQYTSILSRAASGPGGTVSFEDSGTAQMTAQVMAVKGDNPQINGSWWGRGSGGSPGDLSVEFTPGVDDALFISAYSDVYALTSGDTEYAIGAPWRLMSPYAMQSLRLGVGWLSLTGGTPDQPFPDFTTNVSTKEWALVMVRIVNGN